LKTIDNIYRVNEPNGANIIIQGYCGCLTAVSTFILELDTIKKRRYIYAYAIITLLFIQIVYIILAAKFSFLCSPQS
ncbi:unnamed protein product, partial [Rotaria sordida]